MNKTNYSKSKNNEAYFLKLAEEGMSYEKIRTRAKSQGVKGEDLRDLMREIDNIVLEKQENQMNKSYATEWMLAGACMFLISAVMFYNAFATGSGMFVYMAVGCLSGGITVFITGRQRLKE